MLNNLTIFFVGLFAVLSVGVGIFSFWRNPKSLTVLLWFLMSLAVGLWSFGLLLLLLSGKEDEVILYSKILHIGASFIPIFFCHFVLNFLLQDQNKKTFLVIGYLFAIIFSLFSILGNFIVAGASPKVGFNLWLDAGSLYWLFILYFSFFTLSSVYFLINGYKHNGGVRRRKIFYILIAAIIGFGGGMTNLLPQTIGVYPFGNFFAWLYPLLITYGIFIDEIKIKIRF